jgi:HAD superfamily hydrolase (TIGR01509 family)
MARALIFDCDGVLADTELEGHLPAFNAMFLSEGLPVQWSDEEYRRLVAIGGGKERLRTLFDDPEFVQVAGIPGEPEARTALLTRWHAIKTAIYTDLVASGQLPGRPGVARLMREARAAGWQLAVASTSAEPSVRAVLEQVVGVEFAREVRVFAGDVVAAKKPAPDIYLLALKEIGVHATDAVVVEDSAIGAQASAAAGVKTMVTVNPLTEDQAFPAASLVVTSLGERDTPASVLTNRAHVPFEGFVTLATLEAIRSAQEVGDHPVEAGRSTRGMADVPK